CSTNSDSHDALVDESYFLISAASQVEQSTGNDDLGDADEPVAVEEAETVVDEGSQHGDPAMIFVRRNQPTNSYVGLVTMISAVCAERCVQLLNKTSYNGDMLIVELVRLGLVCFVT
uniref:Uncharacterized protein n=1 Tax=Parascaris equorum TaxID=6256 RepID=A0A914R465_PAREQ